MEAHNLPASFYTEEQFFMRKPHALAQNILWLNGGDMVAMGEMYTDQPIVTPIVILAVDRDRVEIWKTINERYVPPVELFISVAAGGSLIQIFAWQPGGEGEFFLPNYTQREIADLPCASKSVAYNSSTVAGIAGAIARAWYMGSPVIPGIIELDMNGWYNRFRTIERRLS